MVHGLVKRPLKLPKKSPATAPRSSLEIQDEMAVSQKDIANMTKRESTIESLWNAFIALGIFGDMWTDNMQDPKIYEPSETRCD